MLAPAASRAPRGRTAAILRLAIRLAVLLALLALPRLDAGAQTYRWSDDKGAVHYTQGADSVPERYRDARLTYMQRRAAVEALGALKGFAAVVTPDMGGREYRWRLGKVEETVGKDLRAMRRTRVAPRIASALAHYRRAAPLVDRAPDAERANALHAAWRSAAAETVAAERLVNAPGSGPWAKRVATPAKRSR